MADLQNRRNEAKERLTDFFDSVQKLADKYTLCGFIIDLAQLVHDFEITIKEDGRNLTFVVDGFEFLYDDEDLLEVASGMDFENLALTIIPNEHA